jgi:leucine dehydrogenase
VLRAIEACAVFRGGRRSVEGLTVAVQGAGAIGAAVAAALVGAGARVSVADLDPARARAVADATGATVIDPTAALTAPVDVVAPCAVGGVIDRAAAEALRAPALVGAANNVVADDSAARVLLDRGVAWVPDPIASAGAVIEGIGESVMGLRDRGPLIDRLFEVALEVLQRSAADRTPADRVAEAIARRRIEAAGG